MRIDILTVLPEMIDSPLNCSILKRAQDKGLVEIAVHNLREYTTNKHRKVDDYPFGGEAGMVMQIEPVDRAIPRRSRWPCASTQSGPTLAPGTWFWTTAAVPAVSRPPQPWRAGDTSGWTTGSVRRREAPTSAGPGPKLPRNELPHCWMLPEILFGRIAYNDSIF